MSDDFSKFTAPRPDEELHQGSEVPVTFSIDPSDRMPVPATPDNQDRPPPLAVDTLVCMEDKRSFVIRNSDGSIWERFDPAEVQRLPNGDGDYFVEYEVTGEKRPAFRTEDAKARLVGHLMKTAQGSPFLESGIIHLRDVVIVEPIRPACAHYLRIQTDISADRSRRYLTRSCMAQRSETGEYVSVGDAAIFACSIRSPRHLESEQILDDFDALKVQQANERVQAGSFDVDAALANEGLGVLGNSKG